ncbi:MAG: hypothetical protein WB870_11605 [Gallionellaceae bacterium]
MERITTSAPVAIRNSSSLAKDNVFVYWCSPKGEIEPAPDSRITEEQMRRMKGYEHWRRCEAVGAREIEKVSLILSRQLFEKKKQMKVQQHLREKAELDQLVVRCRLRLAQQYSQKDVEVNERILKRAKKNEDDLMRLVCSEFDPVNRNTGLEIERSEQSTSPLAHVGEKVQGVA